MEPTTPEEWAQIEMLIEKGFKIDSAVVLRLIADVRRLSSLNTALQEQIQSMEDQARRDQRRIAMLEDGLAHYREIERRSNKQIAELEAQAEGMTGQAARMAARIEELEEQLANTKEMLTEKAREVDGIAGRVLWAETEQRRSAETLEKWQFECQRLRERIVTLQEKLARANTVITGLLE